MNTLKAILLSSSIIGVVCLTETPNAQAMTYKDWKAELDSLRLDSQNGKRTTTEEVLLGTAATIDYTIENVAKLVPRIGRAALNGISPIADFATGTTGILTFQFVDPATGTPVTDSDLAEVEYMANIDPATPDVFTELGTSSDSLGNFGLSYTVTGFEPLIQAIPLDALGNSLIFPGSGGDSDNVAPGIVLDIQPVAEPTSLTMLGMGIVSLGLLLYKRYLVTCIRSLYRTA
jgi:hypothetical protein